MGSGWHEWPLMIFTVFGQCVAGGFIVLALALLKGDLRAEAQQRVIACMLGLWVLMGIGFIASMLHLGSPMRAFNSLNRVGASALSNEIASGSIFFAVGGIGWLLAMLKKLSPALRTLWLVHMQEFAKRKPHQLSGGQRQRVALARSLAETHYCRLFQPRRYRSRPVCR